MKYSMFLVPLAMALVVAGACNPRSSFAKTSDANLTTPQTVAHGELNPGLIPAKFAEPITLDWALAESIKSHPSLTASLYEIKASQGSVEQAGLKPNPTLFGEIEEFGGSGNFSGTGAMSSRIGISQEFIMGNKINKRVREAELDFRIAKLEHKRKIIEFVARVERRFFDVFSLQEQFELQAEQMAIIQKSHDVVAKRVQIGDTSPLDLSRSQVELASVKIETELTRQELESARYALAESWGSQSLVFSTVSAQYTSNLNWTEQELIKVLKQSPNWQLHEEQLARAKASLLLAKSQSIPDIELEGGVQRFNESDNHAFFLGVSIPLPLFDRNQGGINEAMSLTRKVKHEQDAGHLALNREFQETWRKQVSIRQAVHSLEAEVLPAARNAYESMSKAYKAGQVGILGLLDAQRTWVEIRRTRLRLLHELENSRIEIERLTGMKTLLATALLNNSSSH